MAKPTQKKMLLLLLVLLILSLGGSPPHHLHCYRGCRPTPAPRKHLMPACCYRLGNCHVLLSRCRRRPCVVMVVALSVFRSSSSPSPSSSQRSRRQRQKRWTVPASSPAVPSGNRHSSQLGTKPLQPTPQSQQKRLQHMKSAVRIMNVGGGEKCQIDENPNNIFGMACHGNEGGGNTSLANVLLCSICAHPGGWECRPLRTPQPPPLERKRGGATGAGGG